MFDNIQLENNVVNFVGILIKTTENVDLILAAVGNAGVDQGRRLVTDGANDLWTVNLSAHSDWRIRHNEGAV